MDSPTLVGPWAGTGGARCPTCPAAASMRAAGWDALLRAAARGCAALAFAVGASANASWRLPLLLCLIAAYAVVCEAGTVSVEAKLRTEEPSSVPGRATAAFTEGKGPRTLEPEADVVDVMAREVPSEEVGGVNPV